MENNWRVPSHGYLKSLKFLVKLYRCIGFSFSGTMFDDSPGENTPTDSIQNSKSELWKCEKWFKFRITKTCYYYWQWAQRVFFLFLNLAVIAMFAWSLFLVQSNAAEIKPSASFKNEGGLIKARHYFDQRQFQEMLQELRPILRYIVNSLAYVHLIDSLMVYSFNLVFGNQMLRALCDTSVKSVDTDYSIAIQLVLGQIVALVIVTSVAMALYNRSYLQMLYELVFNPDFSVNGEQLDELKSLLSIEGMHIANYVAISATSLLFIYTMLAYARYLKMLQRFLENTHLDETSLMEIKDELTVLSKNFRRIIGFHSTPITSNMAANILVAVGASCFVIINQDRHPGYVSFIFAFALFDFTRMIAVCCAADLVTNQYDKLNVTIFENVDHWTLTAWLQSMEIAELREKFVVTIGGVYVLRQSVILSIFGVILNYIVVLLQTESYIATENVSNI